MKKYFLFLISCLLCGCTLYAQQNEIDSLEKILRTSNDKSTRADAFHRLGVIWHNDDYKKALTYYVAALALRNEIGSQQGIANTSNNIGLLYNDEAKYPEALEMFLISLRAEEALQNEIGVAEAFNNIGLVYYGIGEFEKALKNSIVALKYFEDPSDKTSAASDEENIYRVKKGMASARNNIGRIFNVQEQNDTAISSYHEAFKLFMEIEDTLGMAQALNNIGAAYHAQKQFKKAEENYKGSVALNGKQSDIADAYINLGLINIDLGNYIDALKHFESALEISDDINYRTGKANTLLGIGKLYVNQGNFQMGEDYLKQSLAIAEVIDAKEIIENGYENLSELYKKSGNLSEAFEYSELQSAIHDTIWNEDKRRQMEAVRIEYAAEKKDKEIIREKEKRSLLIFIGIVLVAGAIGFGYYRNKRLKAKAFKEITEAKLASLKSLMDKHFISGSLSSIDGFLVNHDPESASDYLTKYSKLIRNILHFSTQPEVTLEEEIELCKSFLYLEKIHYDNRFDYSFEVDEKISLSETLFPSLLLQPIIENAVKHGIGSLEENKEIKGFIKVVVAKKDDKLICRVIDNGRGLGFSGNSSSEHQSYSGKGITERIKVYNSLRRNKASFKLSDNHPGVTAELIVPYMVIKQTQKMTA